MHYFPNWLLHKTNPMINSNHRPSSWVLPAPRITPLGVGLTALCWTLYALLYSIAIVASTGGPFFSVFLGQWVQVAILSVLSIPAWYVVVKRMDRTTWLRKIAAHLIILPVYAWLGVEGFIAILFSIVPEAVGPVSEAYWFIFLSNLTLYIVQFGVIHTFRIAQTLRMKERQASELMILARDRELEALKAQINPHFLFNTLNSINGMVRRDPEETREMIAQLGDLLRYALDSSKKDLVSLEEEIDFIKAYLRMEGHRYPDRLSVQYCINVDAQHVFLPAMVLQPLVENALKHGITPGEQGGCISIRVEDREELCTVVIEDDGQGDKAQKTQLSTSGIGISTTRERLQKRLGPKASLETHYLDPKGFQVTVKIPYERTFELQK